MTTARRTRGLEWGWDSPIHDIGDLIPDVLTTSHDHHDDHYDPGRAPEEILHRLTGTARLKLHGVTIEPFRTSEESLAEPDNTCYLFEYRGLRVLHLGDSLATIQAIDDEETRRRLLAAWTEPIDLVCLPIESQVRCTEEAVRFIGLLRPRCVLPMHYWSEQTLHDFLDQARNTLPEVVIETPNTSQLVVTPGAAPESLRIVALKRAPFRGWET